MPLFTERALKVEKINLIENGKNISNDTELCNIFNGFFSYIISEPEIRKKYDCILDNMDSDWVALKVINNSNIAKSCQRSDIPTKAIKMNKDIFATFITNQYNYCTAYGEFPDRLKHTDVIPIHKKNEKCGKTNYRQMSILTNITKVYEILMYSQLLWQFTSH